MRPMSGTQKKKSSKGARAVASEPLTLWSATIASTRELVAGIRLSKVPTTAKRVAAAENSVRARLDALSAPVRSDALARKIG